MHCIRSAESYYKVLIGVHADAVRLCAAQFSDYERAKCATLPPLAVLSQAAALGWAQTTCMLAACKVLLCSRRTCLQAWPWACHSLAAGTQAPQASAVSHPLPCRFLNDALGMLWPAFDTALCNLIRAELEPFMRECAPSMVQGLYFERLSFGLARPSILGVRSVPSWNAEHLAIGAATMPYL